MNGSSLDLFKQRGIYYRCQKNVVNSAGIFCGNFVLGMGNTLHARRCGAEVVTSNILRMTSLSLVKSIKDIGKDSLKGDMRRGGHEIPCFHNFGVIFATFEI